MNEIITTVAQQISQDDIYLSSYKDYLDAKKQILMQQAQFVGDYISFNGTNMPLPLDTVVTVGDDKYTTLENIKNAIISSSQASQSDINPTIGLIGGGTITLDTAINFINDNINSLEVLTNGLESIQNNANDYTASANLFLTSALNKFKDCSNNVIEAANNVAQIIATDQLTIREKVSKMSQFMFSKKTEDAMTYSEMLSASRNADISSFTGVNPIVSVALSIKNRFEEIDLDNIKTAITTGWNAVKNSFLDAVDYMKTHADNFAMNLTRKTLEVTNVSNCDFESLSGGDGTVDNCFLCIDPAEYTYATSGGVTTLVRDSDIADLRFSIGETTYTPETLKVYFDTHCKDDVWYNFDIPGARISLMHHRESGNLAPSGYHMRVRFRPIDISLLESDYSNSTPVGNIFMAATNNSAAWDPSMGSDYFLLDDYMFNCVDLGKVISAMYVNYACHDSLHLSPSELGFGSFDGFKLALLLLMGNTTGGINPTFSGHEVSPGIPDPTNADFMSLCTQLADMSTSWNGVYNWEPDAAPTVTAKKLIAWYLLYCFIVYATGNLTDQFSPYTQSTSISKGSYYIRSDEDNISRLMNRTKNLLIAVAVTATVVGIAKCKKAIRTNAVTANLQASNYQQVIAQKLRDGIPLTSNDKNQLYSATRKAVRLNNLTKGFASITTGLSTWNTSDWIPLTSSIDTTSNISRLITG